MKDASGRSVCMRSTDAFLAENINKRYDRKKVVLFLNAFQCISLIVSPQPR